MGQILPTTSYHRGDSILYALVCEEEISHIGKNSGNLDLVCKNCALYSQNGINPLAECELN